MRGSTSSTEHLSRRLVVVLPMSYDDARARYEAIVPTYDASAFAHAKSWNDTLDIAGVQAPHGFMLYARFDAAPMMVGSPSRGRATEYLMGNHTIAETMFRHDPGVLLHAPLRTLISAGDDDVTRFSVDQPSLQFASLASLRSPQSDIGSMLCWPASSRYSVVTCQSNSSLQLIG